jgi:N-acetylglucosaminyl-diphospho-decaprenol L-rhamnosyltransferase
VPQLSFIIVNWNGGEFLRRCLESIVRHPPSFPFDVWLVDNASTDDSRGWLHSPELPALLGEIELHLIENSENVGFGRANNQAFAASSAPLLFLLNADAELTPGACDILKRTLTSGDDIGACGPRILNPDGSLQISVWRNPPTAWATLLSGLRLAALLPKRIRGELLLAEYWDHNRRRNVDMLGGAAILVRREVIDQVGGFDERFHMYGEDNEWCLRITRAGWRLVFEPDAVVIHQGGHGAKKRWTDIEKLRVQTEATLRFLDQVLPRRRVITNLMASCGLLAVQRTLRRLSKRSADDVDLVLQLHLRNLKKALRAKP